MMRVGQLIKEYESQDTLFLIYYGGHARIDESRQSTWCAYVLGYIPTISPQNINTRQLELETQTLLGFSKCMFSYCDGRKVSNSLQMVCYSNSA